MYYFKKLQKFFLQFNLSSSFKNGFLGTKKNSEYYKDQFYENYLSKNLKTFIKNTKNSILCISTFCLYYLFKGRCSERYATPCICKILFIIHLYAITVWEYTCAKLPDVCIACQFLLAHVVLHKICLKINIDMPKISIYSSTCV